MTQTAEDEDEERRELEVYPTDNLLVAARTEDDVSQLDVYVYDDSTENFYIHHDLLLPAMPLCLEWLDFTPASSATMEAASAEKRGNFVAVGTLDPEIEIWSLDVIDGLYPDAILGPPRGSAATSLDAITSNLTLEETTPSSKSKKKKKAKKPKKPEPVASASYHTDSVLALSWNASHRNLLASSSADTTIKLWDLSLPSSSPALRSYAVHSDKVQALSWSPSTPTVLLSGSWDGTVRVFDSRSPTAAVGLKVASEIECLKWNSWNEHEFFISLDNGLVQSFDARTLSTTPTALSSSKPLWTLSAHDKAVSALDYSKHVRGFLVTGGTDKTVKLWNTLDGSKADGDIKISLVASRDLGVVRFSQSRTCCSIRADRVCV